MHESCGCRITAITPAFQAGDVGSTPIIRLFSTTNFNPLKIFNQFYQLVPIAYFDKFKIGRNMAFVIVGTGKAACI